MVRAQWWPKPNIAPFTPHTAIRMRCQAAITTLVTMTMSAWPYWHRPAQSIMHRLSLACGQTAWVQKARSERARDGHRA